MSKIDECGNGKVGNRKDIGNLNGYKNELRKRFYPSDRFEIPQYEVSQGVKVRVADTKREHVLGVSVTSRTPWASRSVA